MRGVIALLALALAGEALAACGSGARSTHTSASAAARSSAAASTQLARRRALAFANAVNLTASDVSPFTPSSQNEGPSPSERQAERQLRRCAGPVASARGLAEVSSKNFELKRDVLQLGVSSEVDVAPSSAQAAQNLAAIRSAHVRSCFSRYLDDLFKGPQFAGGAVSPVSIQSGTPPAPGTTGSFGWRAIAGFAVQGITIHVYLDMLGFVDGPAQVTLFSSGVLRPFPATVQERLFSLLLVRAKAHRL
jgi:hypothetical protein